MQHKYNSPGYGYNHPAQYSDQFKFFLERGCGRDFPPLAVSSFNNAPAAIHQLLRYNHDIKLVEFVINDVYGLFAAEIIHEDINHCGIITAFTDESNINSYPIQIIYCSNQIKEDCSLPGDSISKKTISFGFDPYLCDKYEINKEDFSIEKGNLSLLNFKQNLEQKIRSEYNPDFKIGRKDPSAPSSSKELLVL